MTLSLNYGMRAITLADEPFLWEMLYQAIYVPQGTPAPSRDILHQPEICRYVQNWGQPYDRGILAIDHKSTQPIGAAWLRLLRDENKGYGYVDEMTPELTMAVVPAYRGRGIGTILLSHLLLTAQAHYPAASLSVSLDNPALRLYQRMGFEVVGTCGTSITMRRKSSDKRGGDSHAFCPSVGGG
ncbi:GNAT family N-acetyltransferase [Halomonas sp. EGI 63088]|uniref:GNAT family N-acetyltransferase n=1 Tax=Halomonas flagellata TaxID=2920385 RepID=A0ABS9RZW5_9GAMM|nr:GNAT family N-acetyltransferase [Halomonas flagellata]MCH4565406.1 GNAT family N-acetyltransferase [Halomonas flagellata]